MRSFTASSQSCLVIPKNQELTVNLIRLSLTDDEAARLFQGFSTAGDTSVQKAGNTGIAIITRAKMNVPPLLAVSISVQLLFVWSESPAWKDRIQTGLLPKLGHRAVVLNWSQRAQWTGTVFAGADRVSAFRRAPRVQPSCGGVQAPAPGKNFPVLAAVPAVETWPPGGFGAHGRSITGSAGVRYACRKSLRVASLRDGGRVG